MAEAFICDAIRPPVGRFGGSLATGQTDSISALGIDVGEHEVRVVLAIQRGIAEHLGMHLAAGRATVAAEIQEQRFRLRARAVEGRGQVVKAIAVGGCRPRGRAGAEQDDKPEDAE